MEQKLYLGNCIELINSMEDKSINLVVSSPPYNIGKSYEKKISLTDYLAVQTELLERICTKLTDDGSIFWQVGSFTSNGCVTPLDVKFFQIFENLGMFPINRIIWIRQHGLQAKNKFSCRHETILWFAKSMNYKFNLDNIRVPQKYKNKKYYKGDSKGQPSCHPDGKNPGDVWAFGNVKHNHEEQTIHPCQFPEDMVARIILATTEEGDVVFDPYMGTGTVAVVARDCNRRFLGAELDEKYFDVAQRRLKGEPDENGFFPNLKTLRDYVERTGEPINNYRYDLQKGVKTTERGKSKINSEYENMESTLYRLEKEEYSKKLSSVNHLEPIIVEQ